MEKGYYTAQAAWNSARFYSTLIVKEVIMCFWRVLPFLYCFTERFCARQMSAKEDRQRDCWLSIFFGLLLASARPTSLFIHFLWLSNCLQPTSVSPQQNSIQMKFTLEWIFCLREQLLFVHLANESPFFYKLNTPSNMTHHVPPVCL